MKQLALYFGGSISPEIRCIIIKRDQTQSVDQVGVIIFVKTNLKTYKKFKMLATLASQYSEDSWDKIHYGFDYDQFDTFKELI